MSQDRENNILAVLAATIYVLMLRSMPLMPNFILIRVIPNCIVISCTFPFFLYWIVIHCCIHHKDQSTQAHPLKEEDSLRDSLDFVQVEQEMEKLRQKYPSAPRMQRKSPVALKTQAVLNVRSELAALGQTQGKIFEIKIPKVHRLLTFEEILTTEEASDELKMHRGLEKLRQKYP